MSDTAYQSTQQSLSTPVQSPESASTLPGYTQASGNTAIQDELGLANGAPYTPADLDEYLQSNPADTELVLSAAGPAIAIPAALRNEDVPEVAAWLEAQSIDDVLVYGTDEVEQLVWERLPAGSEWTVSGSALAGILGVAAGEVEATVGSGEDGFIFRLKGTAAGGAAVGVGAAAGGSSDALVEGGMVGAGAEVSITTTMTWYLARVFDDLLQFGSAVVARLIFREGVVDQLTALFEAVAKTPPMEVRQETAAGVSADGQVAGSAGVAGAASMSASAGVFVASGFDGAGEAYSEISIHGEADIEAWAGPLDLLGVKGLLTAVVPSVFKDGTNGSITLRVHAPISEVGTLDPSIASFTISAVAGDWGQSVEAASLAELPAAIEAIFGDVPLLDSEATEDAFCGQLAEADVPERAFTTSLTRDVEIESVVGMLPEGFTAAEDSRGVLMQEMDAVVSATVEVPANAVRDVVISETVMVEAGTVSSVCASIADGIGRATLANERVPVEDNPDLDVSAYADEASLQSAELVVTDKQAAGLHAAAGEGVVEQAGAELSITHTTTVDLSSVPFATLREVVAAAA